VTVTCVIQGVTEVFECAGMLDTKVVTQEKDYPSKVARDGFDLM
jgi:hypothetical protein